MPVGVGVLLAPLFGEVAAEGCGQDGLAEAFEEGWDGVEGLFGVSAAGGEFFDFGDYAALFVEGWEWQVDTLESLET